MKMGKHWHDNAFFGLHFDLHARETDTVLGRDVTEEGLIQEFEKIKPDFVQCDCKGHPGYTSYPTKVGIASPGIVKDSLRIWRNATQKMGIPLIMHYSGVWDTAAIQEHPEYARIEPDGKPHPDSTCPLSAYTEQYLIPQMEEIIDTYDVDGFWVDGENWASAPCYCDRCTAAFIEKTGITPIPRTEEDPHWKEWADFSRENFVRHVDAFSRAIHRRKAGCTSCSNWMYTLRQPDDIKAEVDYLSGDFSWVWSIDSAIPEARIMDGRGLKWDLMAWAFTSHGPMSDWIFKSVPALCQEAGIVMSCGGAFTIYDTPNRWGPVVSWHMDDLADVARFCRARQAFSQNTATVPQAVVLHSQNHYYAHNRSLYDLSTAARPVEGALYALLENTIHTDLLTETTLRQRVDSYPLCVVPEQDPMDPETLAKLKAYVRNGGALIVSGVSCKAFEEELGVSISPEFVQGYCNASALTIPDGDRTVTLIGDWNKVTVQSASTVKPILLSRDGGPQSKRSEFPAMTVRTVGKGVIAGIYGPLFDSFAYSHYPGIRRAVGELIEAMNIPRLARITAPASLVMTMRQKEDAHFLHFVNTSGDHLTSPKNPIVESVPPAGPIHGEISMPRPASVTLEPGGAPVHWSYRDGRLLFDIPQVAIHDIVAIRH